MARRESAALLAIGGGVLLLVGNLSGTQLVLPFFDATKEVVEDTAVAYVPVDYLDLLPLLSAVSLALATFGGAVVIAAGWFYRKGLFRTGSTLIALGAGTGVVGIVFLLAVAEYAQETTLLLQWLAGPPGIGLLLIVLARREAKWRRREEAGEFWHPEPRQARKAERKVAKQAAKAERAEVKHAARTMPQPYPPSATTMPPPASTRPGAAAPPQGAAASLGPHEARFERLRKRQPPG